MNTKFNIINQFIDKAPAGLDLTQEKDLRYVEEVTEKILSEIKSIKNLRELEQELCRSSDPIPLPLQLAIKMAVSRLCLTEIQSQHHISVVFAAYKEHNRIRSQQQHEHGENFLVRKMEQLQWLFQNLDNFCWDLVLVDDGCPEGSGNIAREILKDNGNPENVEVLFLEQAISQNLPVIAPMKSTADSQKGGSIEYAMWHAAQKQKPGHIVIFTDADLSTHLGQTGLLVDAIVNGKKNVAIGSRREPESVVIKKGTRNTRGKLFIYLWKRMLPQLSCVIDTQCGFKVFTAETVRKIIPDMIEKKFAFDIELLLKSELEKSGSISRVGIAWIDSEAASTTTDLQPYLSMLQAVARMYRKYLPANEHSEPFVQFIESLQQDQWDKLVDNMPSEIAEREPAEFNDFAQITADDLRKIIS